MEELKHSNRCPFFVEPDICRRAMEQRAHSFVFTNNHFAKQRKAQAERS